MGIVGNWRQSWVVATFGHEFNEDKRVIFIFFFFFFHMSTLIVNFKGNFDYKNISESILKLNIYVKYALLLSIYPKISLIWLAKHVFVFKIWKKNI